MAAPAHRLTRQIVIAMLAGVVLDVTLYTAGQKPVAHRKVAPFGVPLKTSIHPCAGSIEAATRTPATASSSPV